MLKHTFKLEHIFEGMLFMDGWTDALSLGTLSRCLCALVGVNWNI